MAMKDYFLLEKFQKINTARQQEPSTKLRSRVLEQDNLNEQKAVYAFALLPKRCQRLNAEMLRFCSLTQPPPQQTGCVDRSLSFFSRQ